MSYLDNSGLSYFWSKIKAALDTKQQVSNLVTNISSTSTDSQYPSAKCVYDIVGDIEAALEAML